MKKLHILLVEDNPADILLTKEAFAESKLDVHLHVVKDGVQALDYLKGRNGFANSSQYPGPDLILLDLNLPRKSGLEVLIEVKSDPELRTIPVIVLTTSSSQEDIMRMYRAQANCYITKPVDYDQFLQAVLTINSFWLSLVQLPIRLAS